VHPQAKAGATFHNLHLVSKHAGSVEMDAHFPSPIQYHEKGSFLKENGSDSPHLNRIVPRNAARVVSFF
jgi:hypothetical protein